MSEEYRPQEERRDEEQLPTTPEQPTTTQPARPEAEPTSPEQAGPVQSGSGSEATTPGGPESHTDETAQAAARTEGQPTEPQRTTQQVASEVQAAVRQRQAAGSPTIDPEANSDDRLMAALAYGTQIFVPLLVPIILLVSETSKVRPFQRYHAVQSLGLTLAFALFILMLVIGTIFVQIIPILGQLIGAVVACFTPLLVLGWLALMVYYTVLAYQGKRFTIPGLTSWMQAQGWL